jgi:hypothetical protein
MPVADPATAATAATATALARFPTLRIGLDDRPSYYGFGTRHVRIEAVSPRRPFRVPPMTESTRAYARRARRAFAEAGMVPASSPAPSLG